VGAALVYRSTLADQPVAVVTRLSATRGRTKP
jgi:hypothetical protein